MTTGDGQERLTISRKLLLVGISQSLIMWMVRMMETLGDEYVASNTTSVPAPKKQSVDLIILMTTLAMLQDSAILAIASTAYFVSISAEFVKLSIGQGRAIERILLIPRKLDNKASGHLESSNCLAAAISIFY
jgi:hypothetical protein